MEPYDRDYCWNIELFNTDLNKNHITAALSVNEVLKVVVSLEQIEENVLRSHEHRCPGSTFHPRNAL